MQEPVTTKSNGCKCSYDADRFYVRLQFTLARYANKYTGKERDTESGLDYFGARYMSSSMGRFMSPDPSGLYFADPSNPQSLNLYSYVRIGSGSRETWNQRRGFSPG